MSPNKKKPAPRGKASPKQKPRPPSKPAGTEALPPSREKLRTVDRRVREKVGDLERAYNDLRSLLQSIETAAVILDAESRIRRFTPAAARLLSLTEDDIGRRLRDVAPNFTDSNLLQDVGRVLDTSTRVESELCSDAGRTYLRRILPCRAVDNHLEGVVIKFLDVTERIEAEAQSRRLAAVLRDSNDAVLLQDLEGRIIAWNRGAERMYGYTEAEALQKHVRDLVPEEARAVRDEIIARIIRGEALPAYETTRISKDGRRLDVWLTVTRLTDERGKTVAIATTERDITERKRKEAELQRLRTKLEDGIRQRTAELEAANAELQRRERHFRMFADNVPALFSYIDATQRYRFVNKQYERQFHRPAGEIIGKSVEELLGERNYQTTRPRIAEVLSGKRVEYEVELEFPDGRRFMRARLVPQPGDGGKVAGFFVLVTDITERKRAEDALVENERRLRAVVETAPSAVIVINEQGLIDRFNPSAERMFGYSPPEVIGRNVKILMPSPYREEHDRYLARFLKTSEARIIGIGRELVAQRKDGSTFPIYLAVSRLHDGTRQLFTGIISDLSERKTLQRDLLTIASEEQRRIGQDLHDVVGQELTGLALLAGSLAEALREHWPAEMETAQRLVAGIERTLLEVRRLSKGLIPVEVHADGLQAALTELAERVSQGAHIRCDFDWDKPVLVENNETATHLFRIAQEAVANALKHAAPRCITISLNENKGRLVLGIRDDGKGISPTAWQTEGMGLDTMQYRAALIGATLSVAPVAEGGTLVTCQLTKSRNHANTRLRKN
ncbi:MAG: PAS domain S-box protein [Deltaproteobacteria bacterium]